MEKTMGEVKVVETDAGFRVEVSGEGAKELLKRWKEGQACCCC